MGGIQYCCGQSPQAWNNGSMFTEEGHFQFGATQTRLWNGVLGKFEARAVHQKRGGPLSSVFCCCYCWCPSSAQLIDGVFAFDYIYTNKYRGFWHATDTKAAGHSGPSVRPSVSLMGWCLLMAFGSVGWFGQAEGVENDDADDNATDATCALTNAPLHSVLVCLQGVGATRSDGRGAETDPWGWTQCMVQHRRVAAQRREHLVLGELQPRGGGAVAGRNTDWHIPDTGAKCGPLRAVHIQQWYDLPLHRVRGRERIRLRGAVQCARVAEGAGNPLPEKLAGRAQWPAKDDTRVSGECAE